MANEIKIAGKMRSATTEGILADAAEIQQKTGLTVEQAIKELDDKAATADSEISNLNANTGISDYEEFSDQKEYKAGTTVLKDGLLKTFTTDHAAGAWNPDEVEDGSIKSDIEKEIKDIKKKTDQITLEASPNVLNINEVQVNKALSYAINGKTIEDDVIDAENYLLSQVFKCTEGQVIRVKYGNFTSPTSWGFAIRFYDVERKSTQSLNNSRTVEMVGDIANIPVPKGAVYFRYLCPYNSLPNWKEILMLTIDNEYPSEYISPGVKVDMPLESVKELQEKVNELEQGNTKLNTLKYINSGTRQYIKEAVIGSAPVYEARNWVSLHELDVKENEVYYLFTCYNNCIQYVILDTDGNVVISKNTYFGGTLKVVVPANGVKLQWVSDGSASRGWYLKVENDTNKVLLSNGTKESINIDTINSLSENVTLTQGDFVISGEKTLFANVTNNSTIKIPINGEHLRVGIWVSIPTDENGLPLITAINYCGGTKTIGDYIHNNFYFLQVVNGKNTFTELTLSFTLKEGADNVNISISSFVVYDLITKPIYCIDFDGTYESMVTEDGGIYDYLFKTLKLPATIHTADNTYYNFTDFIKSGQIDYSVYGGTINLNDDNKPTPTDLINNVVNTQFDIENKTGVMPNTIAFRKHYTTPAYSKILKRNGFNSSRFGWGWGSQNMSCGIMYLKNDLVVSDGSFANASTQNSYQMGILDLFAHRLSDDGQGSATTEWAGYKQDLQRVLELGDSALILNLRQLFDYIKKDGLIEQ